MEPRQYQLLPDLTPEEYSALKADIMERGVKIPVEYDEDGNILDGHHRAQICEELGIEFLRVVRFGMSEQEKIEHVLSLNLNRRHLTREQRRELIAKLREQGWSTRRIAEKVGVSQATVSNDLSGEQNCSPESVIGADGKRYPARRASETPHISLFRPSSQAIGKAKAVMDAAESDPEEFGDLVARMDESGKVAPAYRELRKRQQKAARPKPVAYGPVPALHVGDAKDLHFLSDGSVDLIITSPPYNLGTESWPMGGEGRRPRENGVGYEDDIPEEAYQAWQWDCLMELWRVARHGASLFYVHKVRQRDGCIIHPMDWLFRTDWFVRQEIIWDRGSTHNHCPTLFWPHDERIYWLTKGSPALPERPIGFPTIWQLPGPVPDTWHPAPFCEELPQRCMEAVGRPGIVVLDPFGGSMTTCRAAQRMGYESIGVDVHAEYIERAREEYGWTTG